MSGKLDFSFVKGFWVLSLFSVFQFQTVFAVENNTRVTLTPKSAAEVSAGDLKYEFQLQDLKGSSVSPKNLKIAHEKKLHLIVYDPSLKEFQHVHPEFDGKLWSAKLKFSTNGNYWIWAQGTLTDKTEFNASARLNVKEGKTAWPAPPKLEDLRNGSDGSSVATLDSMKIEAGKEVMLNITLSRNDKTKTQLAPYLGAFAHIVAVPESGDDLIHVHPMPGSSPDQGMIHSSFPKAGGYRLWIQYKDGGRLITVPLSVHVNP